MAANSPLIAFRPWRNETLFFTCNLRHCSSCYLRREHSFAPSAFRDLVGQVGNIVLAALGGIRRSWICKRKIVICVSLVSGGIYGGKDSDLLFCWTLGYWKMSRFLTSRNRGDADCFLLIDVGKETTPCLRFWNCNLQFIFAGIIFVCILFQPNSISKCIMKLMTTKCVKVEPNSRKIPFLFGYLFLFYGEYIRNNGAPLKRKELEGRRYKLKDMSKICLPRNQIRPFLLFIANKRVEPGRYFSLNHSVCKIAR